MIDDIDKDTVDFQPNYDESAQEPMVLPARFPNLLVNGAGGIAVGMATNIPPHNLGEVIDACCALIDDPGLSVGELIEKYVPGPDFPTGAIILGRQGILSAYQTGRGSVIMRARTRIEEIRKDRPAIIVDEIPYQVNKARMVEIIAEVVRDKRIEGIADLRDESDRDGMRVVIETQARRRPGDRAQPAVPLHAAADLVRHQHAGARRPPAADDEPEGDADRLHRLPRGGDPRRSIYPAAQGARAGACAGRPGRRRRQHRRGGRDDPPVARSGHRARSG